jgi:crotonobetainyl-CoA:carnitine CoA-transferase CaiB-like acyl-CoA transferase
LGRGEGQVVDVALYEAVFNLMESLIPEYDVAGIVRERTGSSLPGITPSNTYCSGDGSYVAIGGNSDAIFRRLMKAIGQPELGEDPRYRTNADRTEHAEELDSLIEDWVRQHTTEEIMQSLDEAAVPVGPIYSVEDIVEDEQYHARDMLLESEIEGIGTVKMPGLVPKLSETPGEVEWYGGPLGAHNEEVYGGLLGLSAKEIERLSEEGVI